MDIRSTSISSGNQTAHRHEQLVKAAGTLVSQTFFGQMFKQMRNDPFKSDLFSGGRGGQMFSSLLDQTLTKRMSRGAGSKLVRSIVQRLERQGGINPLDVTKTPRKPDAAKTIGLPGSNPYRNVRIHVAPGIRA